MVNDDGWMAVTGFAKLAGVHPKTVLQARKMGYLGADAVRSNGTTWRIHAERARKNWAAACANSGNTSPELRAFLGLPEYDAAPSGDFSEAAMESTEETTMSRAEALKRRAIAEAKLKENELLEMEMRLLDAEKVHELQASWAAQVKKMLLALPARIAQAVRAAPSEAAAIQILIDGIGEVLETAADPSKILAKMGKR